MHGPGGDEEFLSRRWLTYDPGHLELNHAVDDHDQFVGAMHVILPAPSRRVDPEVAAKSSLVPIGFNMRRIDHAFFCVV
jgi:hypothetical protein